MDRAEHPACKCHVESRFTGLFGRLLSTLTPWNVVRFAHGACQCFHTIKAVGFVNGYGANVRGHWSGRSKMQLKADHLAWCTAYRNGTDL